MENSLDLLESIVARPKRWMAKLDNKMGLLADIAVSLASTAEMLASK